MQRRFILGSAVVLLITLTGCPPTPIALKTVVLSPSPGVVFSYREHDSNSGPCFNVPTYGTGPEVVPPGQIAVGWEDMFVPGAQPFPCNYQQQMLYRGHVQFDLRRFDSIADATLTYAAFQSENQTAGPRENPPQGYATVLGMATGQADYGNGPMWWPYDNDVALPPCRGNSFTPCSVDVSYQSNQWTQQNHFNYGFIMAGPKLDYDSGLPQDNNAQLTWYGNFQLTVLYNPALNPRAPQ